MAGIRPVFEKGPLTYSATTVADGGNIKAGQMVEFSVTAGLTARIKPCGAASARCLGVAIGDAAGSDFANADTTDVWGNTTANMTTVPNEVAVAYQGVWRLKCTAAVAPGELVATTANGEVGPLGAGVFGACIGRCVEPGGIAAGAKGKILLGGVGA